MKFTSLRLAHSHNTLVFRQHSISKYIELILLDYSNSFAH
ncbi:hypothetical protein DF3PA_160072 [Candidatus Defluviicoccus seviourii]|uniref:Uncharacterized protein n=1 Tax=Candidatus Defluviicoccus seviourii TaxID=2565273 RepID=A0A564WBN5_9PROT|nr:hypothetical protein DF3PA_160072 [Candidatus Defluviicoccus seviourii]